MNPIIGVIPLWDESKKSIWMLPGYLQLLENAGASPMVFPLTDNPTVLNKCLEAVSGILFTGGHDISPEIYGEDVLPQCGEICSLRDTMEQYIFNKAMEYDMPVLGICRGIQLFNVMLGGTLYQDLFTQRNSDVNHVMTPPYNRTVHKVSVLPNTPLSEILGDGDIDVNSYHHQAIKDISKKLEINGVSQDGLTEAVSVKNKTFALAIQWHPEFDWKVNDNSVKLVKAFVNSANLR